MPSDAELLESAIAVIEHTLRMPVLERHKRDVISGMLWKITEIGGKYTTRYRSRGALAQTGEKLQHEHVFTRKDLTDQLLANPSSTRDILKSAIGCVVTQEEHRRLSQTTRRDRSLRDWARYEAAGVEVVDTRPESAV